jgi:hypothetical protein
MSLSVFPHYLLQFSKLRTEFFSKDSAFDPLQNHLQLNIIKIKASKIVIIVILRISSINTFLALDAVLLVLDASISSYIKRFGQSKLPIT